MKTLFIFVMVVCAVIWFTLTSHAQTLIGISPKVDFYLYANPEKVNNKVIFTGGYTTRHHTEVSHFLGRCDTRTFVVIDTYLVVGPKVLFVGKGPNKIYQAYTNSAMWLAFDILCGKLKYVEINL